jgi:hypothetical protein
MAISAVWCAAASVEAIGAIGRLSASDLDAQFAELPMT